MTSARQNPRQDRAISRFERVLDATARLLRVKGVEALTMARIAAEAGVGHSSLYRYFVDRDAVVTALARRYLDDAHNRLVTTLEGLRSPADARRAIRRAADEYVAAFAEDPALRRLWAGTLASPELLSINTDDTRRNGALFAARLGPFTDLDDATLLARCVLMTHLMGATVSLVTALDDPETGQALLLEFARMLDLCVPLGVSQP